MSPLISAAELASILQSGNLILIDVRSGPGARERYLSAHLPGARHTDLERDLSVPPADAAQGGRHPLPAPPSFGELLGRLGIIPSSHVIVYDDKHGAMAAARFWWMLKAAGHEKVQVLNGGLQAAERLGLPLTGEITAFDPASPYPVSEWKLPMADIETVADAAADPERMVLDVREAYRYRGESEPIDLVAGHIPGAVNLPYVENLDDQGLFLSPAALAEKYSALLNGLQPSQLIVHCGSGVTACHTLLALSSAGLQGAALYVGSWSEWSRNDRPIASSGNSK